MQAVEAKGVKFKFLGYQVRVWKYGFEYAKGGYGRVRFFPWAHTKPRYK